MMTEKELKDIFKLKIGIEVLISELRDRKGCGDIIQYLTELLESVNTKDKVLVKEMK